MKVRHNLKAKKYDVTISRTEPDIYDYALGFDNDVHCEEIGEQTAKCYNVSPGTYNIKIYGQTKSCDDLFENTMLYLPEYNKYSEDPLCKGIEEFVLCQPTYDKEIDYDTFVSRVNTYKKTKTEEENETITPKDDNGNSNRVLTYIKNNLFDVIVISAFIILMIITIILTLNSIKKSRRLEWPKEQ